MLRSILISFLFLLSGSMVFAQKERPNIIFILTDDQRWDALGAAGNPIIQTPNMDQLAKEGLFFRNAFVTTPICAASRASILTGTYERTHQFTFSTPPLSKPFTQQSYPYLLKQAGYQTGFFGKLGVNLEGNNVDELFDESYITGSNGYFRLVGEGWKDHIHLTDHTTDKALAYMRGIPKDKPFCISLSYNAPHADDPSPWQYVWPERHNTLYEDFSIPSPLLGEPEYFSALPDFLQDSMTLGRIRWHWRYDTPEKYQRMVKGYYRMITTIDDNLGRIRKALEEEGIADNTVIILLGDNGYFLGERSLAGKWLMYENSLRVPLIVYDPRKESSAEIKEIALNIDIAPTILELANVKTPAHVQGESLTHFYGEKDQPWREEFLCEHLYEIPYIPKSEGIRTSKWKYFRYIDQPNTEELYDLDVDPLEKDNLINDPKHSDLITHLRKKLDTRIQQLTSVKLE